MKEVFFLLVLFATLTLSSQSSFDSGFKKGFCAGYKDGDACGNLALCPLVPLTPLPTVSQSIDSYTDGYNTGFKVGLRKGKSDCNSKTSSNKSGSYASPKQISNSGTTEAMNDLNNSINNAMTGFAAGISSNISNNSGNIVSLNGIDLDGYKYFVIKKVKSFKSSHISRIYQKMKNRLERKGFEVIFDSLEFGVAYPKDLQNNLNLGIYSFLFIEKSGYWWQSNFKIFTYKNDLIHHRTQRFDNLGIVNESMEPFLAYPYSFDQSKVVNQSTLDSEANKILFEDQKKIALKKLKESKELFDLGVISKEEYDQEVIQFRNLSAKKNKPNTKIKTSDVIEASEHETIPNNTIVKKNSTKSTGIKFTKLDITESNMIKFSSANFLKINNQIIFKNSTYKTRGIITDIINSGFEYKVNNLEDLSNNKTYYKNQSINVKSNKIVGFKK